MKVLGLFLLTAAIHKGAQRQGRLLPGTHHDRNRNGLIGSSFITWARQVPPYYPNIFKTGIHPLP